MNKDDDTSFGAYLNDQADKLGTPLAKSATAFSQALVDRVAKAVAEGDNDNSLQGDLEILKAEFLDSVLDPGTGDGTFSKVDVDKQIAWGWANVSTIFGDEVVDHQNDTIDMEEMQKAAHDFITDRSGGVMHEYNGDKPKVIGKIVESIIFDNALQKALGINLGREGWFIGVKVEDPAVWKRIKDGELKAFSIGGSGVRKGEEVEKAWTDEARKASAAARRLQSGNATMQQRGAGAATEDAISASARADKQDTAGAHYKAATQHERALKIHENLGGPDSRDLEEFHTEAAMHHSIRGDDLKAGFEAGRHRGNGIPRDENGKITFPEDAWRDNEEERGKLSRIVDEDDEDAARQWYGKSADTEIEKFWTDQAREASMEARRAHSSQTKDVTRAAASDAAYRRTESTTNTITGKWRHTNVTSGAHQEAAEFHEDAAKLHRAAGDEDQARQHEALAGIHWRKAKAFAGIGKSWSNVAREASARARAASKKAREAPKGSGKASDLHLRAALAHHEAAKVYEKDSGYREGDWGPGADPVIEHLDARDRHTRKANPYTAKQEHLRDAWLEGAAFRDPGRNNSKADTLKYILRTTNPYEKEAAGYAYDEGKAARKALTSGEGYVGKATNILQAAKEKVFGSTSG